MINENRVKVIRWIIVISIIVTPHLRFLGLVCTEKILVRKPKEIWLQQGLYKINSQSNSKNFDMHSVKRIIFYSNLFDKKVSSLWHVKYCMLSLFWCVKELFLMSKYFVWSGTLWNEINLHKYLQSNKMNDVLMMQFPWTILWQEWNELSTMVLIKNVMQLIGTLKVRQEKWKHFSLKYLNYTEYVPYLKVKGRANILRYLFNICCVLYYINYWHHLSNTKWLIMKRQLVLNLSLYLWKV